MSAAARADRGEDPGQRAEHLAAGRQVGAGDRSLERRHGHDAGGERGQERQPERDSVSGALPGEQVDGAERRGRARSRWRRTGRRARNVGPLHPTVEPSQRAAEAIANIAIATVQAMSWRRRRVSHRSSVQNVKATATSVAAAARAASAVTTRPQRTSRGRLCERRARGRTLPPAWLSERAGASPRPRWRGFPSTCASSSRSPSRAPPPSRPSGSPSWPA